jgi:antagonist of KipI
MRGFKVIHPGMYTTYQDLGRKGFRKYGIPLSGAMDTLAFRAANLLVGNAEHEPGLEVTLQGLEMVALAPLLVAVTGADLQFSINSEYYSPWRSSLLKAGDVVHFKRRQSGLRAYLAVRGGFRAPTFMGSCSVFERGSMGTPLRKDEILEVGDAPSVSLHEMHIPEGLLPEPSNRISIRVIVGPQIEAFTPQGVENFQSSTYRITPQSDRMAYRLEGPRISHRGRADIISEPVVPGSIQVPSDGQPIILAADAQVTGGYAKIATAISADLDLLAQALPGNTIRFEETDQAGARQARIERRELLDWIQGNAPITG